MNATIASFQELSESAASFLNDFERETATLDTGVRKQIIELKGFEPQSEKAAALEERMRVGREKFEDLGKRLKDVRCEIESWERRELEWQERISRRLRIFWAVVGSAVLVVLLGIFLRNWPEGREGDSGLGLGSGLVEAEEARCSQYEAGADSVLASTDAVVESILHDRVEGEAWYPASLADRRESLQARSTDGDWGISRRSSSSSQAMAKAKATDTEYDPLRVLDEL